MDTIRVLLFGPEAAAMKSPYAQVAAQLPITCGDLRAKLAEAHPQLRPFLPNARFAVNTEFASETHPITAADEVALIGMVSGG